VNVGGEKEGKERPFGVRLNKREKGNHRRKPKRGQPSTRTSKKKQLWFPTNGTRGGKKKKAPALAKPDGRKGEGAPNCVDKRKGEKAQHSRRNLRAFLPEGKGEVPPGKKGGGRRVHTA